MRLQYFVAAGSANPRLGSWPRFARFVLWLNDFEYCLLFLGAAAMRCARMVMRQPGQMSWCRQEPTELYIWHCGKSTKPYLQATVDNCNILPAL